VPNIQSAKDRVKRTERERLQNKSYKSKFRNLAKKVHKAIDANDKETVKILLPELYSAIDRTAKIGAIHKNQAARRKSRVTKKVNALLAK